MPARTGAIKPTLSGLFLPSRGPPIFRFLSGFLRGLGAPAASRGFPCELLARGRGAFLFFLYSARASRPAALCSLFSCGGRLGQRRCLGFASALPAACGRRSGRFAPVICRRGYTNLWITQFLILTRV